MAPLPPQWLATAVEMRTQGHSYDAVGERVFYSGSHVRKTMIRCGCAVPNRSRNDTALVRTRHTLAARLRAQGLSWGQVASQLGYASANSACVTFRRYELRMRGAA